MDNVNQRSLTPALSRREREQYNENRSPTMSTEPAESDVATIAAQTRSCQKCGASIEPLDKFCHGCGDPQAAAAPVTATLATAQKYLRCENCGAEITIDPSARSYVCPFCDSTYVVEFSPSDTGRQAPEFIVGFAIAPDAALERFRKWLADGGIWRPSDLRLAQVADKLKGVYLPFWSFSMRAHSRWSASIGEHWYRTETYTTTENGKTVTRTRQVQETEWWNLAGEHHNYYSGYLVSGSKGLPQADALRIGPFQLPALKRYEPAYLAGWLSEEYSVEADAALAQCQQEFARREQSEVAAFLPGDTSRSVSVQSEFSEINSDLILLPVYLLSYRYGDKLYRFMLNGQTGRMAGARPLSAGRIGLAVGIGVLVVVVLAILFAMLR